MLGITAAARVSSLSWKQQRILEAALDQTVKSLAGAVLQRVILTTHEQGFDQPWLCHLNEGI